ncbi:MAG: metal ABC transporter permease [Thermomicrobiales bacterium]|nr:metal ABC transporter permease [Thermomicrobiales bacterium]
MGDTLHDLIFDYTLRNVALGSALLGIVSGVLGSFAVLRRQGLLGDTLSHAALPGICIAFLLTGSKDSLVLLIGAAIAGWIGSLLMLWVVRETVLSEDAALGIVLSTFFGVGIVLLSVIQHRNDANQAGIDRYLFGQAAALIERNVITFAVLGGAALFILFLLYKEMKLFTFDPAFGDTIGFNSTLLSVLMTTLLVIAIAIGLQTVGVVLMAAMIIGPGAAARQWTNRLGVMLVLGGIFGAAAGICGAVLSVTESGLPTGPMIILSLTVIVVISLLFGSAQGILRDGFQQRRNRRNLAAPDFEAEEVAP